MVCLTIPNFDLKQTMLSSQDPMTRVEQGFETEGYIFFKGKHCVKVEQRGDKILFSCTERELFDTWFDYFDLSYDYASASDAHCNVRGMLDARVAFREATGVHVLRQDPWDVLLKQMVSSKLSPSKAVEQVNAVFEASVDKKKRKPLRGFKPVEWFPVPTIDELIDARSSLMWFCDTRTVRMMEYLLDWLPSHRMLLEVPESHSLESARTELEKLPLSKHAIDKVLAYGFHFDEVSCIPESWQQASMKENGVSVEDMLEYELGSAFDKPSYSGTMLAMASRKAMFKKKGLKWG